VGMSRSGDGARGLIEHLCCKRLGDPDLGANVGEHRSKVIPGNGESNGSPRHLVRIGGSVTTQSDDANET
jgi:hypothetical protein